MIPSNKFRCSIDSSVNIRVNFIERHHILLDCGVSITFVVDFCEEFNLWDQPTCWVCENIIKPACATGGPNGDPCRYVDLPAIVKKGVVGRAKTFASHAWGAPFGLIVAALLEGEPDRNRHVWIDIFAVFQFEPKPEGELRFDSVIPGCSSFLLVMPFVKEIEECIDVNDEALKSLPMLRIWCLDEIFEALQQKGMVVVMKAGRLRCSEEGVYQLDSSDLGDYFLKLRGMIDIAHAKASVEADRLCILEKHNHELLMVNAKVCALCAAHGYMTEEVSTVISLVSCAAMGDSKALTRVMDEKEEDESRAFLRVCAGRGFTVLLRELLYTYSRTYRVAAIVRELVYAASETGQIDCLRLLTDEFSLFDVLDSAHGMTAVDLVVKVGSVECLRLLMKAPACHNAGDRACIQAATEGKFECLRVLLEAGADADAANRGGYTASMYAARRGHTECLRLLIKAGANVNAANEYGRTACMNAAGLGRADCLLLLLEAGADVHATNEDGRTACMLAAEGGHRECLRLLLGAGADVNAVDAEGRTVCMFAARFGHPDCFRLLLEAGADIHAANTSGTTACILATNDGRTECLRMLLEAGADVNAPNKNGWTACMRAVEGGHTECLRLLLQAGADVNAANLIGSTACVMAAYGGHAECLRALLEAGADVNAANKYGATACMKAALLGHEHCLRILIGAGCDTNAADKDGMTSCIIATLGGHTECVRALVVAGCDVNAAEWRA